MELTFSIVLLDDIHYLKAFEIEVRNIPATILDPQQSKMFKAAVEIWRLDALNKTNLLQMSRYNQSFFFTDIKMVTFSYFNLPEVPHNSSSPLTTTETEEGVLKPQALYNLSERLGCSRDCCSLLPESVSVIVSCRWLGT